MTTWKTIPNEDWSWFLRPYQKTTKYNLTTLIDNIQRTRNSTYAPVYLYYLTGEWSEPMAMPETILDMEVIEVLMGINNDNNMLLKILKASQYETIYTPYNFEARCAESLYKLLSVSNSDGNKEANYIRTIQGAERLKTLGIVATSTSCTQNVYSLILNLIDNCINKHLRNSPIASSQEVSRYFNEKNLTRLHTRLLNTNKNEIEEYMKTTKSLKDIRDKYFFYGYYSSNPHKILIKTIEGEYIDNVYDFEKYLSHGRYAELRYHINNSSIRR